MVKITTTKREVPCSNLSAWAVVPFGKPLCLDCLVPKDGGKSLISAGYTNTELDNNADIMGNSAIT